MNFIYYLFIEIFFIYLIRYVHRLFYLYLEFSLCRNKRRKSLHAQFFISKENTWPAAEQETNS